MPVDPKIAQILEAIANAPRIDYRNMPPLEAARAIRSRNLAPAAVSTLAVSATTMSIDSPHGPIALRIYRPPGPGPFGALVSFHGGGWVSGSIDADDSRNRALVHHSGCAIVSVGYRLAPEYRFPVALEDCWAATSWLVNNAAALGLDARRIGIGGSSSGGNLAAAVALCARRNKWPALAFQLLMYPVCDADFERPSYREHAAGFLLEREQMRWFWDQYVDAGQRTDPRVSPLRAPDLSGLPPTLIITAEFDILRDEAEAYGARLREAGVDVTVTRYDGMIHGFMLVAPTHPTSLAALTEAACALRLRLGRSA